jgi:hypothetical protein
MPSASSFNCAPDAISTPSVCWVESSPDWRAGHGDASVGPTMKGSPRPRFASDTATGAPGRVRFAYVKALASTAGA